MGLVLIVWAIADASSRLLECKVFFPSIETPGDLYRSRLETSLYWVS